jgi:plasmid maintenance system antidote protein VapI
MPRPRIERIIREKKGISANTALRLGTYFRTSPEFWLNLQNRYELDTARRKKGMARKLRKIECAVPNKETIAAIEELDRWRQGSPRY